MYVRLDESLWARTPVQRRLDIVAENIRRQGESQPFRPDARLLDDLPNEAQTVYWAWYFLGDAEGGGVVEFLLGQSGLHAREVLAALRNLGAAALAARVEGGIALLLREDHPEF